MPCKLGHHLHSNIIKPSTFIMAHDEPQPHGSQSQPQSPEVSELTVGMEIWQPMQDVPVTSVVGTMMRKLPEELVLIILEHLLTDYDYTMRIFAPKFSPRWKGWEKEYGENDFDSPMNYMRAEIYTSATKTSPATYEATAGPIDIKGCVPKPDTTEFLRHSPALKELHDANPGLLAEAMDKARQDQIWFFTIDRSTPPPPSWSDPCWKGTAETPTERIQRIGRDLATQRVFLDSSMLDILPFHGFLKELDYNSDEEEDERYVLKEQDANPKYYNRIRHLMLGHTGEDNWDDWFGLYKAVEIKDFAPGLLRRVKTDEHVAWFHLDWSKLTHLRSLHISLDCLANNLLDYDPWEFMCTDMIKEAAQDMCHNLSLDLLVIYGLKSRGDFIEADDDSWSDDTKILQFDFSAQEVEQQTLLAHLGQPFINFFKVFRGALREGGKLILLDERYRESKCHKREHANILLYDLPRVIQEEEAADCS